MTEQDERAKRIAAAKERAAAVRQAGAPPLARTEAAVTETPLHPAMRNTASTPIPSGGGQHRTASAASTVTDSAPPPADGESQGEAWRGTALVGSQIVVAHPSTRTGAVPPGEALLQSRRGLLRGAFWAGAGVTAAGFMLGFVNFFWPRRVIGFGGVVRVPAAVVPAPGDDPRRIIEGKFYLVNLRPGEGVPPEFSSYAAPSQTGGLLALYQKCPHLGCTVPWRADFAAKETAGVKGWFRCPCHASTYSKAGVRVAGPAPRSMDTMPVRRLSDGSLEVDTSAVLPGGTDNANRAVLG